jgi:hypothetical protein
MKGALRLVDDLGSRMRCLLAASGSIWGWIGPDSCRRLFTRGFTARKWSRQNGVKVVVEETTLLSTSAEDGLDDQHVKFLFLCHSHPRPKNAIVAFPIVHVCSRSCGGGFHSRATNPMQLSQPRNKEEVTDDEEKMD